MTRKRIDDEDQSNNMGESPDDWAKSHLQPNADIPRRPEHGGLADEELDTEDVEDNEDDDQDEDDENADEETEEDESDVAGEEEREVQVYSRRVTEVNLQRLGMRIDGWADLIEGEGKKAVEVRASLKQYFRAKRIPSIKTYSANVIADGISNRQRPCLIAEMPNGGSALVYVDKNGQDLYVAWEAYVRPVLNTSILATLIGLSAVLSGLSVLALGGGNFSLVNWFFGTVVWLVPGIIVVAGAGKLLRGSYSAFFFKQLGGFDGHDIAAVLLAVHKSVLHALDSVGISSQTLRLKDHFRSGSPERLI